MDLQPGQKVGRYRLISYVGRGSISTVWKAFDDRHKREVAVKLIAPELAAAPEFRRAFEREATILARLDHPNVLTVLDFGEQGELLYMVTRFLSAAPSPSARAVAH